MKIRRLLAGTVVLFLGAVAAGFAQSPDTQIVELLKAFDAALNGRDLNRLAGLYHKDVTIFEGGSINRGWADYRDNHLGPELRSFESLEWTQSNVAVHTLGATTAYVTANYSLKYKTGERSADIVGIATYLVIKEQDRWMIRHAHTSGRVRTPQ